jgi:hypothetical protein
VAVRCAERVAAGGCRLETEDRVWQVAARAHVQDPSACMTRCAGAVSSAVPTRSRVAVDVPGVGERCIGFAGVRAVAARRTAESRRGAGSRRGAERSLSGKAVGTLAGR